MNCPACGQLVPVRTLDGSTYLDNHVETITRTTPYWIENDSVAWLVLDTRLCPASGREVDTQT